MTKTTSRILYTRPDDEGTKTSKNNFILADGREVQVIIYADYEYQIIDWENGDSIKSGQTKSNQMVLRLVKNALIELGANIVPESRKTKGKKRIENVEHNK